MNEDFVWIEWKGKEAIHEPTGFEGRIVSFHVYLNDTPSIGLQRKVTAEGDLLPVKFFNPSECKLKK